MIDCITEYAPNIKSIFFTARSDPSRIEHVYGLTGAISPTAR